MIHILGDLADLPDHPGRHLGIAVYTLEVLETKLLKPACLFNAARDQSSLPSAFRVPEPRRDTSHKRRLRSIVVLRHKLYIVPKFGTPSDSS